MDEEKKAEASGDEVERVGPYQLQEQVPQEDHSRVEVYRATHETTGAPTLLLKPAAEDEEGTEPLPDCRVRFISSTSPSYVAVEVEHTPWCVAPDKHSVEELVCTFEDVQKAMGRMDQALHPSNEARPGWRLRLALSGAAALVVALLPGTLAPVDEVRDSTLEAWVTDVHVDPVPGRSGNAPRPVKNQKQAPCTEGLEVEVSGVCWLPIAKSPCPPQTVPYQGQCLLPVAVPRPPVTSLDGGSGSEPR
ncbi:MAG TPA: hypothetical protein VF794_30665 [Archangium sp.]|jgi:hypothetical protein|uniref:hypothetical protein n=1 Tax=Archangium sp. TaxID=1872627 RepID=UPI002ED93E01